MLGVKKLVAIVLLCTLTAVVAGCTDDNFPRYLTKNELKNVKVQGGHKQLDPNGFTGKLFLRIRNNNKKFDIYDISVKCFRKEGSYSTFLLSGKVSSGMTEQLEVFDAMAGMRVKCSVNAAKAGL